MRIHEVEQQGFKEIVVALCDTELIGKTLSDDFFVNPRFYQGEHLRNKRALDVIRGASMVNAIGNKSVSFLIKHGFVKENETVRIDGVMHAQIFVVEERRT